MTSVESATVTAPPVTAPVRSSVPSHGIRGWSQLIQASLVPSGDAVGNAKNCAPVTRTRMAAASDAADPSSGTATIARLTFMPPPVWNPGSGSPSSGRLISRTHQISRPSGERVRSANLNPAPSGVSGAGAPPAAPDRYSRWSAKFAKTRSKPGPSGTGRNDWPPYSCTRLRAYHGAGSSSRGGASPAAAAMIVTRPPSAGRLSCHQTSSPATAGNETATAPLATSAALIGDVQVP